LAILEALSTALDMVLAKGLWYQRIRIFTDAESCVRIIEKHIGENEYRSSARKAGIHMNPIVERFIELANCLGERGSSVELCWVKRGKVSSNIKADAVADRARRESWVNPPRSVGTEGLDKVIIDAVRGNASAKWQTWRVNRLDFIRKQGYARYGRGQRYLEAEEAELVASLKKDAVDVWDLTS
jgi:ribonuclease HI